MENSSGTPQRPLPLTALIDALEWHFADEALSRAVVGRAGMSPRRIRFEEPAYARWPAIVDEAIRQKALRQLVEQAAVDATAPELLPLLEAYESSVELVAELAASPPPAPSVGKRTNIVIPPTTFVGRDRERSELAEILKAGQERLVTLSGGPGFGKTRLAQQVGRDLLDAFPGGCWFASLINTVTLTGIAHEIAQAFDVSVSGPGTAEDGIVDLLAGREPLLLILDNFEKIVEYADESVGYWLEHLPNVTFFVTSRAPLRLGAEYIYQLNVFDVPPKEWKHRQPEEVLRYDSVRLFVDRARRVRRTFKLDAASADAVMDICRTVDGIALSIELAAARMNFLDASQIAKRLEDRFEVLEKKLRGVPDRYQTLYASIDWSFQLLEPFEQHAFLQLSIFRGGFFLEAAEQVLDLSVFVDAPPVADVVQSLYEQNLLQQKETEYGLRFDMLVSIDDFGKSKWEEQPAEEREALARRWAEYYIPYVNASNAKVNTKEGVKALDLLTFELENIFDIQEWFLTHGEPVVAATAILAFAETMAVRGPAQLRVPRLSRSLEALSDEHTELRVWLMTKLSAAQWALGEWNEATEHADAAVKLSAGTVSHASAAALRQQARIRTDRGYLRRAFLSVSRAKKVYEQLEGKHGAALLDGDLAGVYDRLGDFARAIDAADNAIAVAREAGNDSQHAIVLNRKGLALWHHGHPREALAALGEAERISTSLGARTWIGGHRTNAGLVHVDLDELDPAMERFAAAESILQELRTQAWVAVNLGGQGRAFMMRGGHAELERALQLFAQAGEISRKVYYPENISFHAGDMGRSLFLLGRFDEARRAVREAVALERMISASRDLRHFGNLVTLARIAQRLGRSEECAEAIVRARELLAAGLDVRSRDRIRRVREDVEALERLVVETPPLSQVERRVVTLLTKHGRRPPDARELDEIARVVAQSFSFSETSYEYPWNGLADELQAQGAASFPLFGYGSLVNRESVRKTCRAENFAPALAFGVVRHFDYDMPDALREHYYPALRADDPDRAVLNVEVTGFLTDVANGVAFDVGLDEIDALRKREVGYDLKPIVIVDWDGDGVIVPRSAFVLTAPNRLWKGRPLTNASLNPYPPYLQRCAAGAESFSPSFLGFWRDTTFLADGETLIA